MNTFSIRLRLTAWYSAVLFLGLLLFGFAMWVALERHLVQGVDSRLQQRIEGLRTVLEVEGLESDIPQLQLELSEFAREVPDGSLIELRNSDGVQILPFPSHPLFPPQPHSALPQLHNVESAGRRYRLLTGRFTYRGRDYDALVAAPLDEVHGVIAAFRSLLLLMIPAVLASACFGGYWISRRALSPVDDITRVARSISVRNLSQRLMVPRTGDELQRMSEAWNGVLARLDDAVQRIRQFTADASHELRTPVALIRASAELALRRDRPPEDYRKALRDILEESERMTQLTEALLTLARADSGGLDMPLAPADLNSFVSEVVSQSAAIADDRGIHLRTETASPAAMAVVNESAIRRLLLILLDNALKHTPSGGSVTISTAARDGLVVLSVQDTGEGIAGDALPHIFERFYRADAARGGDAGAGLGLSIAQVIAQAHGADIKVESAPGAGARFFLTLQAG